MRSLIQKFILSNAVLFLSLSALAQSPVITHTNQMHSIGDAVVYVEADIPFGFDINTAGGADINWNFPTLTSTGSITFSYEDPGTAAGYVNFPTADDAMANTSVAGHEWFDVVPDTIRRLGYTDPSLGDIYYDNGGFVRYRFPFEAGDAWSTLLYTANTTLNLSGMPTTIDNGNYSVYVDAYGTLTLPTGVTENVVRVHAQESFDLMVDIGIGTPYNAGSIYDDYYFWFNDGVKDPVMIYGATDTEPNPLGNPGSTKVLRYQDISTGLLQTDERGKVGIYPNPGNGLFELNLTGIAASDKQITAVNALGETVYSGAFNLSTGKVDLSGLDSGIYFITISGNGFRSTNKVIIE